MRFASGMLCRRYVVTGSVVKLWASSSAVRGTRSRGCENGD